MPQQNDKTDGIQQKKPNTKKFNRKSTANQKPVQQKDNKTEQAKKNQETVKPKNKPKNNGQVKPNKQNGGKISVKPVISKASEGKNPAVKSLSGRKNKNKKPTDENKKPPIKIIPLGGLGEIGKNFTCFECGNDMFVVDCGLAFPEAEMLGVDLVIPDFTYVERNQERLKGIVLTHGHEDHIGSLPYFLKKVNTPIYGTGLTIGLVGNKLKEHGLLRSTKLNVVTPGQTVKFGCMAVEFIRVNHSIPDAVALAIHTPAGIIVHTGDFKIDTTPINGEPIDLARFGELGKKGVLLLMSDSTNAERPGFTSTEKKVGESFEKLFTQSGQRRIIIASFSSNIHRIQQVADMAVAHGRKLAVFGRSMINVVSTAIELGYLKIPDGLLVDVSQVSRYPDDKIVIVTTGSQGEPMSALSRMATNDHRQVNITPNDMIIISATPIPGNEKFVGKVVNELLKSGAKVIYEAMYEVHVSGHACQEELKLIMSLTRPKFFMPVHGEYKHMKSHAQLALSMGIPEKNIIIAQNGQVIETDSVTIKKAGIVPSGRLLVDGLGVGDVGSIVLRDRKHLAEDGLIIAVVTLDSETHDVIAGPEIVSRGFVYVRESEELIEGAKRIAKNTLAQLRFENVTEWNIYKQKMKEALDDYIFSQTKRKPMVLPIIMEV